MVFSYSGTLCSAGVSFWATLNPYPSNDSGGCYFSRSSIATIYWNTKGIEMDKITLSVQTVNMIMGYLGTKSYQEVFQIIEAVQKEVSAQQPTATPPAETTAN